MVLTGSCPWPGSWPWSYGAHLHCRPVRIQTPTANAVPSALPDKTTLRGVARQIRARLAHPGFAARLVDHARMLSIAPGEIVAGYYAHQDEADPKLLLQALAANGAHIAFPRMA